MQIISGELINEATREKDQLNRKKEAFCEFQAGISIGC